MNDLIEALQIFNKYLQKEPTNYHNQYPTGCEHDILRVYVEPNTVSDEDKERLVKLGFIPDYELYNFRSTIYGSC